MNGRPHLVFLITEDWYFWSHRLDLAKAARDAGFEVSIATRVTEHGDRIRREGFRLHPLRLQRRTRHPLADLMALLEIVHLYRRIQPQLVHHVAMKPILYGSLAAWFAGIPAVVNTFAGLGYVFTDQERRGGLFRVALLHALKIAIEVSRSLVVVQNVEDRNYLIENRVVRLDQTRIIAGSGVNTEQFVPGAPASGVPIVLMASRMLWDKGVEDFVEAARLVKRRGIEARFVLAGRCDPHNPAAIPPNRLQAWVDEGDIEWWGHCEDMPAVLSSSALVVLPSLREGLPKVLLEAAACGKPVVATDVPGCREVVRHQSNGLLVPPHDPSALADAIASLLADVDRRTVMGQAGRDMVVREYSVAKIAGATLALYRELLDLRGDRWQAQALV